MEIGSIGGGHEISCSLTSGRRGVGGKYHRPFENKFGRITKHYSPHGREVSSVGREEEGGGKNLRRIKRDVSDGATDERAQIGDPWLLRMFEVETPGSRETDIGMRLEKFR